MFSKRRSYLTQDKEKEKHNNKIYWQYLNPLNNENRILLSKSYQREEEREIQTGRTL